MLIAHLSDIHVGAARYRQELLRTAIAEINAAVPDLVVVAGDITDDGYPDQYPVAKQELSALACKQIVRVPGNHDARNVGYLRYEDTFGSRDARLRLQLAGLEVVLVAVDSSKPVISGGFQWSVPDRTGDLRLANGLRPFPPVPASPEKLTSWAHGDQPRAKMGGCHRAASLSRTSWLGRPCLRSRPILASCACCHATLWPLGRVGSG